MDPKDTEHEIPVKVVDRRWWARGRDGAPEAAGPGPSAKPTYVEELEQRLAEKDRLLQEHAAKYREAAGDFEEARVRIRREVARDVERGRRAVLLELLEVLDNLDRALEAARSGAAGPEALLQGVALVRDQFLAKLRGFGVVRLDPIDEPFNPLRHEAVAAVPAATADRDGLVVAVVRPGYTIGDEVLRPASVTVAKSPVSPEA